MHNYTGEDEVIRTADLSLASTIYLFQPLIGINKKNPKRAEFLFTQSKELDDLIDRFWRSEIRVDPRKYFEALRTIKARLYN